jgi:F0F1-type ATP synthase membrane subunit b/b'
MTGQEKIVEVVKQVEEIKSNIQKKYDKIMGKIAECQEKLNEIIQNAQKNSQVWVEKQKTKIMNKINMLKKKIEDWLKTQMEKAQAWLDNIKQEIMDFIAKLLMSMVLAITGI